MTWAHSTLIAVCRGWHDHLSEDAHKLLEKHGFRHPFQELRNARNAELRRVWQDPDAPRRARGRQRSTGTPQHKRTPQAATTPPGRRRSAPVARGRRRSDSDDDSDEQGTTPTATPRVQPQRAARKAQPIVDADPDAEQPPPPTMPCARAVMRGGPLMYVEAATQIWGPPGTPPPFGCPWTPAPRRRAATPRRRRSGVG